MLKFILNCQERRIYKLKEKALKLIKKLKKDLIII